MQKNYKIEKISSSGHGLAFDTETQKEVSILGVFPGDEVNAEIYKTIGNIHYAKIISFDSYSKQRIYEPANEPFFDANAPWKYLSQETENKYKKGFMLDLYEEKLNNIKIEEAFVGAENGYRNKVAYTFLNTKNGLKFALYTRGIGEAQKVEQLENMLAYPLIEKVGKQFLHFFNQKNIKAEQLKYLILRYSFSKNKIVAYLLLPETNRKKLPFKKKELELFMNSSDDLEGILVSNSPAGVRSSLAEKDFYSLGNIEVKEKMLNKTYSYAPSLFFQINPISFVEILQDIREYTNKYIKDAKDFPILDLFAGVGIIGIELADLFQRVTGVELSALSKKYALLNAKQNNVENFNFVEANVDEALDYINENQILIIDPPRKGLSNKTLQKIKEKQPKYIFYVSCNPQTQHNDFLEISKFYTIEYIKMYNLFPKTHHIESLIILKKNSI